MYFFGCMMLLFRVIIKQEADTGVNSVLLSRKFLDEMNPASRAASARRRNPGCDELCQKAHKS